MRYPETFGWWRRPSSSTWNQQNWHAPRSSNEYGDRILADIGFEEAIIDLKIRGVFARIVVRPRQGRMS
jgi:hypothetical protein